MALEQYLEQAASVVGEAFHSQETAANGSFCGRSQPRRSPSALRPVKTGTVNFKSRKRRE